MESGYVLQQSSIDPLRVVTSNVHTNNQHQMKYDAGVDLSAGFHTYGAELNITNGVVSFYLDGVYKGGYTGGPTEPMFLLLNSHVANKNVPGLSTWHTVPTSSSSASMQVYGVRVFEKSEAPGPGR